MKFLIDNWWYFLIAGVMVYMMFGKGGCCGGGHESHNGHSDSHGGGCCGGGQSDKIDHKNQEEHISGDIESFDTARDPVCGMSVSKKDAISREINGKTYYFCGKSCANEFEKKYSIQ